MVVMHPALYVLARQRIEEQFDRYGASHSNAPRVRTLYRARTSLGTVLVIAGNRLIVPGVAPSNGQYAEQKAS
ncbi:MAG: hypothetical protein ACRDL8_03075 [Solirubrobacteraceae bacterium]